MLHSSSVRGGSIMHQFDRRVPCTRTYIVVSGPPSPVPVALPPSPLPHIPPETPLTLPHLGANEAIRELYLGRVE